MKISFQKFNFIRALRRDKEGSCFIVNDIESGANLVLRTITRRQFDIDRAGLSRFYAWFQTQCHPHLGRLLHAGIAPNHELYWTREYLETAEQADKEALLRSLVSAVTFLHADGYIHRRIRPSNILAGQGSLKLVDARPCYHTSRNAFSINDIHFTAPEIFQGGSHNVASDLYSLGATLYFFFVGRTIFEDIDTEALKSKYLLAVPNHLQTQNVTNERIAVAIDGLISKKPGPRLEAFQALQAVLIPDRFTAANAPFIGRGNELQAVQTHAFKESGTLSTIYIEGASGIGKTRLLDELQRRSQFYKLDFVMATCSRSNVGIEPLRCVLLQLLGNRYHTEEERFQTLGKCSSPVSSFIGSTQLISQSINGSAMQVLSNDLIALIAQLSRIRPIVLAFDDVQNASVATRAFLMQLCLRRRDISGSLLLAGRNSDDENRWLKTLIDEAFIEDHRLICLLPLSFGDSEKIVNHLHLPASQEHKNRILTNANGNPLFLSECAKSEKDASLENEATSAWLQNTLADLKPGVIKFIRFLSLFEVPIPANYVQSALDLTDEDFRTILSSATRADLIGASAAGISVRHQLSIKKAIYISMSSRARIRSHATAFRILSNSSLSPETLATQAFKGQCYDDAVRLCLETAAAFKERDQFASGLEYYRAAKKAGMALGRDLPLKSQLEIADCYARLGRHKEARSTYEHLLSSSGAASDPTLKPVLYARLGSPELKATNTQQLLLYSLALEHMPDDSEKRIIPYVLIAQTLARMGKLQDAQAAVEKTLCIRSRETRQVNPLAMAIRGLVCLHGGQFREATNFFKRIKPTQSIFSMGVMANLALASEYMGKLQAAELWLRRVHDLAINSGHAFLQIMAPNNLGCVLKKQGRFEQAGEEFRRAAGRLADFRSKDETFPVNGFAVIRSDQGAFHLESGQYSAAIPLLRGPVHSEERTAMDNMSIALNQCDLYLRMGALSQARKVFGQLSKNPLSATPFFRNELAVIETQFSESGPEKLEPLQMLAAEAITISVHQRCRLFILLSTLSVTRDPSEAKGYADEAFKIAKKNGYRPLQAQAMMLKGLASGHHREREHWLMQGFKLASEIGMPELIAESAYHIGVHLLKEGAFAIGKEYLLKSTTITSELAEQIPTRHRPRYLAKPWRKDARKRLKECVQQQEGGLPRIHALAATPHKENQFFSALYRVSVIASTAGSVPTFVAELLQALDASVRRPIVLALTRDDQTFWHSNRTSLTDELKKQVLAIAARAKDRAVFDYRDRTRTTGTIAWIPIRSAQYGGGFYIACREHETMVEREMEFLTVLGNVTGNALDQIDGRSRLSPPSLEKNEFCGIVGKSRAIRELFQQIEIATGNNATVLIEGETGAGKEVVARAIHKLSNRAGSPFIPVDCGAIPDGLIESELFGVKRGSYTGASMDRAGLFEAANHGTLFLDEISNMNLGMQAKLLRVLQEREVRRVGETRGRPVDVRLIAATNKSLISLVQESAFRQDLLYRLNVLQLTVPPLRSRREDIPVLAVHFLERLNSVQKTDKVFGPGALDSLMTHNFPGNVRELQNTVERSFFIAKGKTISTVRTELMAGNASVDEVKGWFKDLSEGRKDFWSAIHERYKRRDIPREKIVALVDLGLRATRGSYKELAALFRVGAKGYRRLMDFLRRNECLLDFRPYRKTADAS